MSKKRRLTFDTAAAFLQSSDVSLNTRWSSELVLQQVTVTEERGRGKGSAERRGRGEMGRGGEGEKWEERESGDPGGCMDWLSW